MRPREERAKEKQVRGEPPRRPNEKKGAAKEAATRRQARKARYVNAKGEADESR